MLADLTGPGDGTGSESSLLKTSLTLVQAPLRDFEVLKIDNKVMLGYLSLDEQNKGSLGYVTLGKVNLVVRFSERKLSVSVSVSALFLPIPKLPTFRYRQKCRFRSFTS